MAGVEAEGNESCSWQASKVIARIWAFTLSESHVASEEKRKEGRGGQGKQGKGEEGTRGEGMVVLSHSESYAEKTSEKEDKG
jgi:hypothetical protein